ncbi:transposase [Streptomyces sp. NPDC005549]|uniref:IS701 family transposase n=1 Tax=Streptomyces sp. NPDC005549 TaxID=3154888 RepID=UPI0033BC704B
MGGAVHLDDILAPGWLFSASTSRSHGRSLTALGFQRRLDTVNWRLFLPGSWDPASPKADPTKVARRGKCAIPAQVGHVEKWQLALDMIDETRSWGIDVPQVIADGGYGDTAAFRLGLWLCRRHTTAVVDGPGRRSLSPDLDVDENGRHPPALGNGETMAATCARSQRFCPGPRRVGRRRLAGRHRAAVRSHRYSTRETPPELPENRCSSSSTEPGLEERGLGYVVGISTTTTAHPEDAQPCTPAYSGRGPRPVPAYPEPAQRVKDLVIAAGSSSARPVQWREGSRPGSGRSGHKRMYSRFVALRIRPAGREIRKATAATELPVRWLLAEWPADQEEPVQFWLSNLPATTPLPVLVRTAKLRWRIENDYREMKQALGLAHFEGRTWPGWHHHVTLVSVAHAFCTLQRLGRSPKETASA